MPRDVQPGGQPVPATAGQAAHGLDQLLRNLARLRDDAEWDEFVVRQSPVVMAVVRTVLSSRDDCEDAVQETFMRIHRSVAGYQGGGTQADRRAQAWVAQLARRAALAWSGRIQRRQVALDEHAVPPSAGPARREDEAQDGASVRAALAGLPEPERQSVELRFHRGSSYLSIGALLGVSDVAARKRVARGLDLMRRRLGGLALPALMVMLARSSLRSAESGLVAAAASSADPLAAAQGLAGAGSATGGITGLAIGIVAMAAVASGVLAWSSLGSPARPPAATTAPAVPVHPGIHQYSTSFSADESPASAGISWIGGRSLGLDWTDVRMLPGFACGTESGRPGAHDDSTALLSGSWGPDQSVQGTVRLTTVGPQPLKEVELRLRSTLSPHSCTGYEINFLCAKDPHAHVEIVRWDKAPGRFTFVARAADGPGLSDGDVVKATIVGTVITASINGVQLLQGTDSTFPTGSPGIGFYHEGPAVAQRDFGFSHVTATDAPHSAVAAPAP
jgi:RNA polymerase sigma factor (sigma-70 family)